MSKHKSEDYKISAVNYYLDNDVNMDYVVIFLIVRNNLYQDGFKDIIMINLLNDTIENQYLIKLQNIKQNTL